ncbi:MAG: rhamnulokinase [Actinomycetota bacterium]
MAIKNYLVFDYGASNGRSAVIKFDGKKFEMEVTHRFENKPVFAAGTLYWDILRLYSELKIGIQKSLKSYAKIESLALDTWGADFGFLDKNGKLISNPVHYRDAQREKDSKEVFNILPAKELFDLTGAFIIPLFDLFHMYSLKINNSPEFLNGETYLSMPDLFNYFLTGKKYNEWSRITTSIIYNQVEKKWEDKIIEKFGIPKHIFPEIIRPGNKIGSIKKEVLEEMGIKKIDVVAPITHDTPSAVAGIPVRSNKDWAFISMGTWCCLGTETKKPIVNDTVRELGFFNEGGAEDSNLYVRNITGLWIIQQCRAKWMKDMGRKISWDEIVNLASGAEPFKCFIDADNPQFGKALVDMPKIIRNSCKESNQPVPESIGEIARCVYEGLALKFKKCMKDLEEVTGQEFEVIHLIGGGTKNKLLCQWTADATGIPVIAGPTETTAIGNFIMQLKASGEISSLKEGRKISKNSSEVINYKPENTNLWDNIYPKYLETFK